MLEISDVSEQEALNYLRGRELDEKVALQIYELVGGRMIQLESAANDIKVQNREFDGMYERSIRSLDRTHMGIR